MQVVNGYVCLNCTDVEHAKKVADPTAAPIGSESGRLATRQDLRSIQRVAEIAKTEGPLADHSKPLTLSDRGRQVDLLA